MPGVTDDPPRSEASPAGAQDDQLLVGLRAGDEETFRRLVAEWSPVMLRLARTFVRTPQSGEDVVQDAWLGVLRGLDRFEGRSSLRSWVFTILINRARTRGAREGRTIPWSELVHEQGGPAGPTVDPSRFQGPEGRYPGHWTSAGAPQSWDELPERTFLTREAIRLAERAVEGLPPRQRLVVTLRDVHGLTSDETCEILDVTPENQRVLLHRARAALRQTLEDYYRTP